MCLCMYAYKHTCLKKRKRKRAVQLTLVEARGLKVQAQTRLVPGQPELYSEILSQNNYKTIFFFTASVFPLSEKENSTD